MKNSILLLFVCLLAVSCSKNGPAFNPGTSSSQKGSIVGQVKGYDQYGEVDKVNTKDVKITLIGNTNALETMSDANGEFKFTNVSQGTLKFKLDSKPGYVSSSYLNTKGEGPTFSFFGSNIDFDVKNNNFLPLVLEIPKSSISVSFDLASPNAPKAVFNPPIPLNKITGVVAVMSNTDDVSNTKFLRFNVFNSNYLYNLYFDPAVFPSQSLVYVKFYTFNIRENIFNYSGNPDLNPKIVLSANITGASETFTLKQN